MAPDALMASCKLSITVLRCRLGSTGAELCRHSAETCAFPRRSSINVLVRLAALVTNCSSSLPLAELAAVSPFQ